MTLSIIIEYCYADCCLHLGSLILSVTYEPFMLRVIMLNVVVLIVVAQNKNKHSSLLWKSINYCGNKFYDTGLRREHLGALAFC
jgi:hypothetical protein